MTDSDKNIISMIAWGAFALFALLVCGYAIIYAIGAAVILFIFFWPVIVIGGIIVVGIWLYDQGKGGVPKHPQSRRRLIMPTVPGLRQVQDFITAEEEIQLLTHIDASEWDTTMRRRVQHYGYRYDYRARTSSEYIGELPEWIIPLAQRVSAEAPMNMPTQAIINEYQPGQGIGAHTDSPVFGPVVASVSLGDDVSMTFSRPGYPLTTGAVCRCGLLVLTDEARCIWTHRIEARRNDGSRLRQRRVSITFRTLADQRVIDDFDAMDLRDQGMSYRDIGMRLGCSEHGARQRIRDARAQERRVDDRTARIDLPPSEVQRLMDDDDA